MNCSELINNYQSGYSLEQGFYKSDEIYQKEIDNIFLEHWILAGHASQIPKHGDFFLLEFDKESVIITRTIGRRPGRRKEPVERQAGEGQGFAAAAGRAGPHGALHAGREVEERSGRQVPA